MRLVFAGTPDFSVAALDALYDAEHEIVGVYTQPDRPAGRGQKLTASPVARRAMELALPVFKPERLRGNAQAIASLRALAPEVMVVVAYGLILPQEVLDIPRYGCINIHASLLPRWRGAAPIQRAIQAGDRQTGISIMRMDAGLDTGPVLLRETLAIGDDTDAGALQLALSEIGARLIVETLERLASAALEAVPQPQQGATYASKISKDEARIDWSQPAEQIARSVRAFNPWPVAWTTLDGERVRIVQARPWSVGSPAPCGTVHEIGADGLSVATGQGQLLLQRIQFSGGRSISATEARQGRSLDGRLFV